MLLTKRIQVPKEYSNLPQLKGRAIVELIVKKADPNAQFDIQGLFRLCVESSLALFPALSRARSLSVCLSLSRTLSLARVLVLDVSLALCGCEWQCVCACL